MRNQFLAAVAILIVATGGAQAVTHQQMDDAVVSCMFKVKNAGYLSVSSSVRNGKVSMKMKKTRQARKAKVGNDVIEATKADFQSCVNKKLGTG